MKKIIVLICLLFSCFWVNNNVLAEDLWEEFYHEASRELLSVDTYIRSFA